MEHKKRESTSTFEMLYERCNMMLLKYAKNGQYRFFYEVPEFILGVPIYKLNDAVQYIIEKLLKNGFLVKYYFPKYLYISWCYEEVHKTRETKSISCSSHIQLPMIDHNKKQENKGDIPKLSFMSNQRDLLPPPVMSSKSTQNNSTTKASLIMPHTPSYDLPLPQNSTINRIGPMQKTNFIKSIADYKPSGKFTLNIT
jgi:hypothetical protein